MTAATTTSPLELLALGLAGIATVVAIGSAVAAWGSRRALSLLDPTREERPR